MIGTSTPGNTITVSAVNQDDHTSLTRTATVPNSGAFSIPIPLTGGTTVLNIVATSKSGGTARAVRTVVCDVAPGTLVFGRDDPDDDDHGPGQLRLSDVVELQAGRVRPAALRGLRRGRPDHLPRPHARPDADVRLAARRAAGRRLRPHPRRLAHLDERRVRDPQLHARAVGQADRGPGLRPAVRRRRRRHARAGDDHRQRRLALHHVQRDQGEPRHARLGLGLHGRADRPGRLQPRPGPRLPADAAGVPVRRLRDREHATRTARSTRARCPKAMDTLTAPAELDYTLHPVVLSPVVVP